MPVDQLQLNFSPAAMQAMNIILALIMFGVALDITLNDFRRVCRMPKTVLVGLGCQFFLMPACAFLIITLMQPAPSIALGMILVAACPGGNLSNFLTHLGKGNAAVSITMSAISTMAAILMTPFNLQLWGSMNAGTRELLTSVSISPFDVFLTVLTILIIPSILGMLFAHKFPAITLKIRQPMKFASMGIFLLFVIVAIFGNLGNFKYLGYGFVIVLMVNITGLLVGYNVSRAVGVTKRDARAVSFETGIQNSGFGLILVFNFFDGLGGMALIAAWWGIWHILSGLTLAGWWARHPADDGSDPGLSPDPQPIS